MQRRFGMAIVLMMIVTSLSAQTKFIPKFGLHAASIEAEEETNGSFDKAQARLGWNIGADLRFGSGKLIFQPGLHFHSLSTDVENIETVGTEGATDYFKGKSTINQLKAPLMLGYNLTGSDGLLDFYVKGGITPTYVLSVKEGDANATLTKDDLTPFKLGANIGAAVDIWFLTIDANYEIGMNDFFKDIDGQNNTFTLGIGIIF